MRLVCLGAASKLIQGASQADVYVVSAMLRKAGESSEMMVLKLFQTVETARSEERTIGIMTRLGIDEIHLIKPRGVIANIANNTIVELLPNGNKDTVARYLHNLEGKERIQYVAMDMWAPYRDACQAVIPDANIVIDKFHVMKMANEALEKVRKGLRERLTQV